VGALLRQGSGCLFWGGLCGGPPVSSLLDVDGTLPGGPLISLVVGEINHPQVEFKVRRVSSPGGNAVRGWGRRVGEVGKGAAYSRDCYLLHSYSRHLTLKIVSGTVFQNVSTAYLKGGKNESLGILPKRKGEVPLLKPAGNEHGLKNASLLLGPAQCTKCTTCPGALTY